MEATTILPNDVLEEILVRLPVKHLLQMKYVCKHWHALIRDYGFCKKHYHFQYAMQVAALDDVPLFLDIPSDCLEDSNPTQFYILSKHRGDDVFLNITPDFECDIPPAFSTVPKLGITSLQCMGVVNGVVGLHWGRNSFSWNPNRLALWNPATREFKGVPRWPIIPDNETTSVIGAQVLGLGFDLQSEDFKILGLISFEENDVNNTVYESYLYSLKGNSWKRIKDAPNSSLTIRYSIIDAYLNSGVSYWLACGEDASSHHVIISFNFSTEIFKEFGLPKGSVCHNPRHTKSDDGQLQVCHGSYCSYKRQIGKYKEGLALFVNRPLENNHDCNYEIWAVTRFCDGDNAVPLSWQLVLTIGPIQSFGDIWIPTVRVCGDLLLVIHDSDDNFVKGQTYLYDPSTRTFNYLGLPFCCGFSYVESMFPLSGRIN